MFVKRFFFLLHGPSSPTSHLHILLHREQEKINTKHISESVSLFRKVSLSTHLSLSLPSFFFFLNAFVCLFVFSPKQLETEQEKRQDKLIQKYTEMLQHIQEELPTVSTENNNYNHF